MRHEFVADSADFGKYGLLRALCAEDVQRQESPLRLGVVWYLNTCPPTGQGKGQSGGAGPSKAGPRQYLESGDGRECDPGLFAALGAIQRPRRLNVAQIKKGGVLPPGTVFYSEPLPKGGKLAQPERDKWAKKAVDKTKGCQVVFLDPDTGLSTNRNSAEHARLGELHPYLDRCKSIVLYQHQSREGPVFQQIWEQEIKMREALGQPVFTMLYGRHRGSWVTFFVVPAPAHRELLYARAEAMLAGGAG